MSAGALNHGLKGLWVEGLVFKVEGLGFRVEGLGVQGSG